MIERGRVWAINGRIVIIQQEIGAACFGCMNAACKKGRGLIAVKNDVALNLAPGQLVETSVPRLSIVSQALTVLFPPLVGYAGTFVLTGLAFPGLGEPARAALGVAALAITGFICFKLARRASSKGPIRVIRVLDAPPCPAGE
jgi:positive regulator of sigma E activity